MHTMLILLGAFLLAVETASLISGNKNNAQIESAISFVGEEKFRKMGKTTMFISIAIISLFSLASVSIHGNIVVLILGIITTALVILHQIFLHTKMKQDIFANSPVTKMIKSFSINVFVIISLIMLFI